MEILHNLHYILETNSIAAYYKGNSCHFILHNLHDYVSTGSLGGIMAYESIRLKKEFVIDQIVTIHYFEYMSDFSYPGESHDFWELLCVDTVSYTHLTLPTIRLV